MAFIIKPSVCLLFALLATTSVVLPAAFPAVSPFCITAQDKILCTQLVKGAKLWSRAMINVIQAVLEKAEAAKSTTDTVGSKLPADSETKNSIGSGCLEAYESLIDNLRKSLEFVIKGGQISELKNHLSAVSFKDCSMGNAEINQFKNEMIKLVDILLAVAGHKEQ